MSLEQRLKEIKAARTPAEVSEQPVIDVSGAYSPKKEVPQIEEQLPSSSYADSLNSLKSSLSSNPEVKESADYAPSTSIDVEEPPKDTGSRDLSSWLVGATPLLVGMLTGNTLEGVDTAANYYVKEGAEKKADKTSLQLKIEEMKLKREQEKLKRDIAKSEAEGKETGLKDSDVMTIEDEFGRPIVTRVSDAIGQREYRRNPIADYWATRGAIDKEKLAKDKQSELNKIGNLEFKNREDLLNKREQHPVTKDTYSISKSYNDIVSASKGENAASDLGMIFAYMKMLDPSSVVRESEQLTARQARSPEEALMNVEAWFKEGRTLTKPQIARFVAESKKIRDSQFKLQSEVDSSFKKRAGTRGLDITPYLTIPTEPEIQKETTGKKDELVRVISPSGVSGTVPKSQLKDALSEGYKVAP